MELAIHKDDINASGEKKITSLLGSSVTYILNVE